MDAVLHEQLESVQECPVVCDELGDGLCRNVQVTCETLRLALNVLIWRSAAKLLQVVALGLGVKAIRVDHLDGI